MWGHQIYEDSKLQRNLFQWKFLFKSYYFKYTTELDTMCIFYI